MRKGSRKVQFELQGMTVEPKPGGGWRMRVVLEGDLGSLADVAEVIEEAKAQAPNVVVSPSVPAMPGARSTETVDPPRTGAVPQANVTQAPDSETVQAPGDDPPDLPFDPERRPNAEAVHKRLRKTKGEEK